MPKQICVILHKNKFHEFQLLAAMERVQYRYFFARANNEDVVFVFFGFVAFQPITDFYIHISAQQAVDLFHNRYKLGENPPATQQNKPGEWPKALV